MAKRDTDKKKKGRVRKKVSVMDLFPKGGKEPEVSLNVDIRLSVDELIQETLDTLKGEGRPTSKKVLIEKFVVKGIDELNAERAEQ